VFARRCRGRHSRCGWKGFSNARRGLSMGFRGNGSQNVPERDAVARECPPPYTI
jgi:hypothetical protein